MAIDSLSGRILLVWNWLGWNWKTALLSGCLRAALFAGVSFRAGEAAAIRAVLLEIAVTVALAGFQGALIQAFRQNPSWRTTLACAAAAASVAHPVEGLVHTWAGTPHAAAGIFLSFMYTLVATRFSLLAMHDGAFIAGPEARSLRDDLRRAPFLIARFAGFRLHRFPAPSNAAKPKTL